MKNTGIGIFCGIIFFLGFYMGGEQREQYLAENAPQEYIWPMRSAVKGANPDDSVVVEMEALSMAPKHSVKTMMKASDLEREGMLLFIRNKVPDGTVLVVKSNFHASGKPRVYSVGTPEVEDLADLRW